MPAEHWVVMLGALGIIGYNYYGQQWSVTVKYIPSNIDNSHLKNLF